MTEFDQWWAETVEGGRWTSLERQAARDAWNEGMNRGAKYERERSEEAARKIPVFSTRDEPGYNPVSVGLTGSINHSTGEINQL